MELSYQAAPEDAGKPLSLFLREQGISISQTLRDNDAYHALEACGGLIITGPTGTNVNDVAVALLRP